MSIAHRPFSIGFDRGRHTTSTPKGHHWGWGHAEKPDSGNDQRKAGLTSYPWEGLHLEVDETSASADVAVTHPDTPLGFFLDNLMYGE